MPTPGPRIRSSEWMGIIFQCWSCASPSWTVIPSGPATRATSSVVKSLCSRKVIGPQSDTPILARIMSGLPQPNLATKNAFIVPNIKWFGIPVVCRSQWICSFSRYLRSNEFPILMGGVCHARHAQHVAVILLNTQCFRSTTVRIDQAIVAASVNFGLIWSAVALIFCNINVRMFLFDQPLENVQTPCACGVLQNCPSMIVFLIDVHIPLS